MAFVLAALLVGGAFREWRRAHEERFRDLVRDLEVREESGREGAPERLPSADSTAARSERDAAGGASPAPAREAPAGRVDPNRASAVDLTRLPGIGPALAARIIAERERNGAFDAPEALLRVRGIGPKTLDRIRPFVAFPESVRAAPPSGS